MKRNSFSLCYIQKSPLCFFSRWQPVAPLGISIHSTLFCTKHPIGSHSAFLFWLRRYIQWISNPPKLDSSSKCLVSLSITRLKHYSHAFCAGQCFMMKQDSLTHMLSIQIAIWLKTDNLTSISWILQPGLDLVAGMIYSRNSSAFAHWTQ